MACYYRDLSNGRKWFYKISFDGHTIRSKCIFHSKAEAKRAENDKYIELDEKRRFPELKQDIKLSELIDARLEEIRTRKSESYYKANQIYLDQLLEALGDIWFSDIARLNINNLLLNTAQKIQFRGKGNYTPNAMLRVYKALFNFGILHFDLPDKNPCKGIKFLSIEKRLKYIPSDEEINNLKAKCDEGQKLLIDFVMETGARIGEALRLSKNDILEDSIVLYTRKSKNSNLTPRKIPIPDCLKGKKFNGLIFSRWSELPKFLDKKLREMKEDNPTINIWGWHSLRHRYASKLSKSNTPIFEIMSKLGHSNLETTQGYLHLLP